MMTPNGGVFGRNPTFNNVTVENNLTVNGDFTLGDDIVINDTLLVNGQATFRGGIISIPNSSAPTSNTVLGSGAGAALESGATDNVLIGSAAGDAITTGDQCIVIGSGADVAAATNANSIVIGHNAVGNGSNTTTIGNSSTTGTFIPAGNLTLTNGNFILGTSGKGIDFSATANSSGTMTSELLSDYEEGTWTPTYVPQTGSYTTLTMDTLSATYTKVGRQVTVRAYIKTDVADTGGNTSALLISGLPFAGAAGVASLSAGAVFARNFAGDAPRCIIVNDANTTTLVATKTATSTSGYVNAIGSDLQNSPDSNELIFSCTYFT